MKSDRVNQEFEDDEKQTPINLTYRYNVIGTYFKRKGQIRTGYIKKKLLFMVERFLSSKY